MINIDQTSQTPTLFSKRNGVIAITSVLALTCISLAIANIFSDFLHMKGNIPFTATLCLLVPFFMIATEVALRSITCLKLPQAKHILVTKEADIVKDAKNKTVVQGYIAFAKAGNEIARNYLIRLSKYNIGVTLVLAEMYEKGEGVPQNTSKAISYYAAATEQGSQEALEKLRSYDHQKARSYLISRFQRYQREAIHENPDVQYQLAEIYEMGIEVRQNCDKAVHYYSLAADQDHPGALTRMKTLDHPLARQYVEEFETYIQTCLEDARAGDIDAQYELAEMYDKGIWLEQDYNKAIHYYSLAADQGHQKALGRLRALDMLEDVLKAKDYLQKREEFIKECLQNARKGDANAQYDVAQMYEKGILQGDVSNHETHEVKQHTLEVMLENHEKILKLPNGEALLAHKLRPQMHPDKTDVENMDMAIAWYISSAKKGHPLALKRLINLAKENHSVGIQIILGNMYDSGKGVPQDDNAASYYYSLAAKEGDVQAIKGLHYLANKRNHQQSQILLLSLAERGYPEARRALAEIAEQGTSEAQYAFGQIYDKRGSPSADKAVFWYAVAAKNDDVIALNHLYTLSDNDNTEAQLALGDMYAEGTGVPQNEEQASEYYLLATKKPGNKGFSCLMRLANEKDNVYTQKLLSKIYFKV